MNTRLFSAIVGAGTSLTGRGSVAAVVVVATGLLVSVPACGCFLPGTCGYLGVQLYPDMAVKASDGGVIPMADMGLPPFDLGLPDG